MADDFGCQPPLSPIETWSLYCCDVVCHQSNMWKTSNASTRVTNNLVTITIRPYSTLTYCSAVGYVEKAVIRQFTQY